MLSGPKQDSIDKDWSEEEDDPYQQCAIPEKVVPNKVISILWTR